MATLAALFLVFLFWTGEPLPDTFWTTIIFTSLVMMSFATLFLEHWFTKPTDVLAASTSILLVLSPLADELTTFGIWYTVFFAYNLAMALTSLMSLILLDGEQSSGAFRNRLSYHLNNVATHFGNGRLLYFALFILTLLFYVDSQSIYFIILFGYSAAILFVDPKRVLLPLLRRNSRHSDDIGEIFGVQSKNTFLVKLFKERQPVRRFDFVEFRYSVDERGDVKKGLIIDNYLLNQEQWVKVLTTPDISSAVGEEPVHDDINPNIVYKVPSIHAEHLLERFVGVVVDDSTILKLRFEYGAKVVVAEGTLLEVPTPRYTVLYQIVQGVTDIELLESKNETGLVIGQAVQLGTWNAETLTVERYGWVPEVNSPVYLASDIDPVEPPAGELLVGHIPDTNFPVLLNKQDAITHHLAILGVTGSGKSVFARNLVRCLSKDGVKFVCIDFTKEYSERFGDLDAHSIVRAEYSEEMFAAIDSISAQMAKFPNQRNPEVIATNEAVLSKKFHECIREFLESDRPVSVFELPDVSNTTGILDYTRWFFKMLFRIAKDEKNFEKHVCIVLEEAHTVVPEWNFIGADDRGAQALVNSIGQIALQGRKYGVGFIVIAQ
ncbi:MAG: DUF87 domain-containing protein [Candidatus Poribacteria bacterium]|nr:DUF87 domain-containing protein [Candidatus Poribacteria bacterium]